MQLAVSSLTAYSSLAFFLTVFKIFTTPKRGPFILLDICGFDLLVPRALTTYTRSEFLFAAIIKKICGCVAGWGGYVCIIYYNEDYTKTISLKKA